MNGAPATEHEWKQVQKAFNNFTDKRLDGVPRIAEDGIPGAQTLHRADQLGWWVGMQGHERTFHVTDNLVWRVRNPLTVREGVQGKDAIDRGQNRRDAQKARAKRRGGDVHTPVVFTVDSWGYHPPVHDGEDLICSANAPLYAICDGTIIRADASGWWGKAPSGNVALGDGIIVLRMDEDDGPFQRGLNFCYGHAEGAVVTAGQRVKAGDHLGHAGLAVAWHVHAMVNGRSDALGLGDRDPRPFIDYAVEHDRI